MTRTPLERRAGRDAEAQAGFTLIELLVVVIIIGVLAAIAIPVYAGMSANARDVSAKSDLTNARIALQAYVAQNPGVWPSLSATNGATNATTVKNGWAGTTVLDDSTTAGGSANSYCLKSTSASGAVFYLTESIAPTSTKPSGCA